MRRGFLGSIAALAAGACAAYGQAPMPMEPAGFPPATVSRAGEVIPAQGPAPTLMPPVTFGPPSDPLGLGPTAGLGPPPGPMYPPPGPYGAPLYQPAPPGSGMGGAGGYGGPGGMPGMNGEDCGPGMGGYGYGAPKWWFGGNYMLTFVTPQPIHYPILTTSAPNQLGLLGASSTLQLINSDDIRYSAFSGFQLNGGFYGDDDRRFGFYVSALYTEFTRYARTYSSVPGFGLSPADIPLLARPFIDSTTGPTSLVLANTNIGAGTFSLLTHTGTWGIDPGAMWNLYRSGPGAKWQTSADFLAG
ncbi:MAG TPA: BBP7 family outer membrane beta-barrel protein, partial [Gemmata sp.]|nr:BBP7 family outer membrane beta-barrel protein [Gemmata sp.]